MSFPEPETARAEANIAAVGEDILHGEIRGLRSW
jgi:hypothetical protein